MAWWINANNAPSSISQTINVPADGTYRLSFRAALRGSYTGLRIHADVDGASQGYVDVASKTWTDKTIVLNLTAGEHVISLRGASLVALTKDSYIDMKVKIVFGTGIDAVYLNGKTLFMNATPGAVLTVRCQSIENGTISSSGGGWLDVSCRNMSGVRLEVVSSFNLVGNVEVVDYTSSYLLSNYDGATGNNGSGVIGVAGVFKPLTDYWHACELHGGATIDLSARTSELSAVSFFSKGAKNLAFTEGARVNVKLGTRPVSAGERIIGWTEDTKPANVGTVKFVRGDADRNYGFVVKDDGLYIAKGMMVIVR